MNSRKVTVLAMMFLALVAPVTVQAQEIPKPAGRVGPKHFWTDWKWWVGEGVIVGAMAADMRSSMLVSMRCPQCTEQNRLLGKHPSAKAQVTLLSVGIVAETGLHIAAWKLGHDDPNRFWRNMARWEVPVIVGVGEGYYAHHNYGLLNQNHCQPGQVSCKP